MSVNLTDGIRLSQKMDLDIFRLQASLEETHWWFVGRRRVMRSLIESLLPPAEGTLIADIGCGTGGNITSLADAYSCVGIDPSAEAIEIARERYPAVEFTCGNLLTGELEPPAASLYLMMDVLEHVEDDHGLLATLVRAAPSGAYFLLTVPADPALWSGHDEALGHYRRYTRDSFQQLWSRLPVEAHLLSYFNSRLYPIIRIVRTINRWRAGTCGSLGTDLHELPSFPNRLLTRIFAGEQHRLLALLGGERARGYRRGASLVAVLEKV